jgi:hypothetical protein
VLAVRHPRSPDTSVFGVIEGDGRQAQGGCSPVSCFPDPEEALPPPSGQLLPRTPAPSSAETEAQVPAATIKSPAGARQVPTASAPRRQPLPLAMTACGRGPAGAVWDAHGIGSSLHQMAPSANSPRNSGSLRAQQTLHGPDAVKAPPLENLPARRTPARPPRSQCSRTPTAVQGLWSNRPGRPWPQGRISPPRRAPSQSWGMAPLAKLAP